MPYNDSELLEETTLLRAAIRAELMAVTHEGAAAALEAWKDYDLFIWAKRYAE